MNIYFSPKKSVFIIIPFFLIGFLLRLLYIHEFPQPFHESDMVVYWEIAKCIIRQPFCIDTYRYYGYPFFLAAIFSLFKSDSPIYWTTVQALMDVFTGILIYFAARNLFKSVKIAVVCFGLYILNPFTLQYTGMMTSEILAVFIAALLVFIQVKFLKKFHLFTVIIFSLVLGFFPQIKPGYLFFTVIILLVNIILILKKNITIASFFKAGVLVAFFCLPFIYTLVGNYKYAKVKSPLSLDNGFIKEFYISLFINRSLDYQMIFFPKEVEQIYSEFHSRSNTPKGRQYMANKYLNLAANEIRNNPIKFINWRINKSFFVWDKNSFFPYIYYIDSSIITGIIRYLNLFLLATALTGLIYWRKYRLKKDSPGIHIFRYFVLFLVYTTIFHVFSLANGRYSLPAYPIIFLFSGYTLYLIFDRCINK